MPPPPPPPPPPPTVSKAAKPVYGQSFDPWNSSSTGHQRAENALGASTGWRESRNRKLMSQFNGGNGGGKRVSDMVGEGARDWDPRAQAVVKPEIRERARCSVMDMLAKPGVMRSSLKSASAATTTATAAILAPVSGSGVDQASGSTNGGLREGTSSSHRDSGLKETMTAEERLMNEKRGGDEAREQDRIRKPRRLFDGVVVYLNGSTHPLISDHKLKHVLAEHGGSMSSHLGRRRVTHVILGRPAAGAYGSGSGGGLAGGKLQREIAKIGGPGVKFVGVQWVLESIKAGKRLPEARFADLKIASKGQQSVYGLYSKHKGGKEPASIDEHEPPRADKLEGEGKWGVEDFTIAYGGEKYGSICMVGVLRGS